MYREIYLTDRQTGGAEAGNVSISFYTTETGKDDTKYYKFKGNNTLFWIDFMLDSRYADSGLGEFFISGQG